MSADFLVLAGSGSADDPMAPVLFYRRRPEVGRCNLTNCRETGSSPQRIPLFSKNIFPI